MTGNKVFYIYNIYYLIQYSGVDITVQDTVAVMHSFNGKIINKI